MIKIIPATLTHAESIHVIEVDTFADPWSIDSIKNEITAKYSICFVAIKDDAVVGHVSMRHIINEGHINNIAVARHHRRYGIASLILDALISEAMVREMIGITLEVRVSNQAAISLYEKHGFIIEGYRKNYYSSPTEDAAIMWKMIQY